MATILIVDDLTANRKVLVTLLRARGDRAFEAAEGREALAVAQREHPDLIITDVLMPVMDGYEATRAIRAWEQEQDLPKTQIIALTALVLKEEGEKILQAGCDAHVTKPIKRQTLLEVLQACEGYRGA